MIGSSSARNQFLLLSAKKSWVHLKQYQTQAQDDPP
jgi:hypothetical protein